MKITIEFHLPEDGDKYRSTINSGAAWDALQQVHYEIRQHLKHGGALNLEQLLTFISETISTSDQGLEL
jgi:hypothetical protein